jgi:hypothetical protein
VVRVRRSWPIEQLRACHQDTLFRRSNSLPTNLGRLRDRLDRALDLLVGCEYTGRESNRPVSLKGPDPLVNEWRAVESGARDDVVLNIEECTGLVGRQTVDVEDKDREMFVIEIGAVELNAIDGG